MPEPDISQQAEQHDDWHSRWLAMQAAYADYRRSSDALECTRCSSDEAVSIEYLRLAMMESQQRVAFERYMDARIAFLESQFDERNRVEDSAAAGAEVPVIDSRVKTLLRIASSRPVLQTLGVILLCTTVFSLMREQTRVRQLEGRNGELRASLQRTDHEVQALRERLDLSAANASAAHAQTTAAAPARRGAEVRSAAGGQRARPGATQPHVQQKAVNRAAVTQPARTTGAHEFSLAPSREFKRVGPLSVLVKSIDSQAHAVSLAIVSESVEVNVPLLRVDQPVWVHTAHGHRVGLVADRITANRIEGHLIEAQSKADLRASGMRPNLEGAP